MGNVLDWLVKAAEWFIGLFNAGGANLMGLITGILPTLIVLITAVNAIIKLVGEESIEKFAALMGKNVFTRYTVLPILSVFFLTNPMCYSFGRFLEEKYKPAFYDAAVSFVHPITGLFPHANAGELFIFYGIAAGIETLGYSVTALAVRYLLVGIVVIFIRGVVTERLTIRMMKNN